MKMQNYLTDTESKRFYSQFMHVIDKMLRELTEFDREEVKREIESHIFEHLNNNMSEASEPERLMTAIEYLGDLNEMLDPIVADRLMAYASHSILPGKLLTAYVYNSGRRLRQFLLLSIFSLFQFLLLMVIVISIAKIFNPAIGVYSGSEVFVIGTVDELTNAREVLGYWMIPLAALIALCCYLVIHSLLRIIRI